MAIDAYTTDTDKLWLQSSVDLVYYRTRQEIVRGELEPGAPLRLQWLAKRNSVSLIPVREALRLLEAEGFVQSAPNRGYRVSEVSVEDVVDVYQTRIVLEVAALRRGFDNITPDVIARARQYDEQMTLLISQADPAFAHMHKLVHFTLYEQSRSKWMLRTIETLWDHTERYRFLAHPERTLAQRAHEHCAILEALEARDLEAAGQALTDNLEHTVQILLEAYPPRDAE